MLGVRESQWDRLYARGAPSMIGECGGCRSSEFVSPHIRWRSQVFCLKVCGQTDRRGSVDRGEVGLDRLSRGAAIGRFCAESCTGFDLTGATHADTLDTRRFSYGCPDGELARDERTRSATRGHDAPR